MRESLLLYLAPTVTPICWSGEQHLVNSESTVDFLTLTLIPQFTEIIKRVEYTWSKWQGNKRIDRSNGFCLALLVQTHCSQKGPVGNKGSDGENNKGISAMTSRPWQKYINTGTHLTVLDFHDIMFTPMTRPTTPKPENDASQQRGATPDATKVLNIAESETKPIGGACRALDHPNTAHMQSESWSGRTLHRKPSIHDLRDVFNQSSGFPDSRRQLASTSNMSS